MPATISKGSTGSDVVLCQERLNAWNTPCDVDGIFGPATETAVIEFQSDHGLVPDGIVGDKTWNALLASPIKIPAPPYDALSTSMLVEIAWYAGWDYAAKNEVSLVARPSRLAPSQDTWSPGRKTKTICCVFVAGELGCVYEQTARWTANAWQRFMVPTDDPWGMLDESVEAGIGTLFTGVPQSNRWYVVQGWNGLIDGKIVASSRGHQWLSWGPDLIIEATTLTDEDGDGSSDDPGQVAWRHRSWVDQAKRYEEVRLVELRAP